MSDAIRSVHIDRVLVHARGADRADARRLRRALLRELGPAVAARLPGPSPSGSPPTDRSEGLAAHPRDAADQIAAQVRQEVESR